jgi:cytochrome c-type biogenesis protein CcmH
VSTFWVVAGALTLLVVAALAVPLLRRERSHERIQADQSNVSLYRDQLAELERDRSQGVISEEQAAEARAELGRRLLADVPADAKEDLERTPASPGAWRYVALAAVPIVAVMSYLALGVPEAIEGRGSAQQAAAPADHPHKLEQMTEQLAARLERNPDDAEAWVLLARSNQMLGRPAEALKAYARATALIPKSAQLWADYADMIVANANGDWVPAAKDALARALALDPAQPKALWLAGTEAFVRRDYGAAVSYWQQLLPMAEPGSEVARTIAANIDEARALSAGAKLAPAGSVPVASASSTQAPGKSAAAGHAISGRVEIDPAIAARVQPTDTVFVFARAAQGPKMPLAIRRITVKDLPYEFSLDDSAAMAPGMTISAFDQVVVGARVSRSGDAAPKPGDFQGLAPAVKPGTGGVKVRIDAEVR